MQGINERHEAEEHKATVRARVWRAAVTVPRTVLPITNGKVGTARSLVFGHVPVVVGVRVWIELDTWSGLYGLVQSATDVSCPLQYSASEYRPLVISCWAEQSGNLNRDRLAKRADTSTCAQRTTALPCYPQNWSSLQNGDVRPRHGTHSKKWFCVRAL